MSIACGIDMGSNSFRLLVAEFEAGRLRPLAHALVTVRLGEDLEKTGVLSPAAMARAETALAGFAAKIKKYSPASLRVCATHAVRLAGNQAEFLSRLKRTTGLSIDVISGEEEAALALAGVFSALPPEKRRYPFVLADVGGGSSELIRQEKAGHEISVVSLPIGAMPLSAGHGDDLAAIRHQVLAFLIEAREVFGGVPVKTLAVSGGTATSLAALALEQIEYEPGPIQGCILTAVKLAGLIDRVASLSPARREALPGMGQGRGRIILAGAVILQELQKLLAGIPLLVSDAGLLEGIVLSGACPVIAYA